MSEVVKTETEKTSHQQVVRGIVVSDKMTKTRIIEVKRTKRHTLYHKSLARKTRLFVHDEKNESKVGDMIEAEQTRPLSRHKNFRLLKIIGKRAEAV
jgi:small subunit ribosomal protein S17